MRAHRRRLSFAATAALSVCVGPLYHAEAAGGPAFTVNHLYVALACGPHGPEVLRYRLFASAIAPAPDFTYRDVGAPVAMGPDGTMYAGGGLGECGAGGSVITAFAFGHARPLHTLSVFSGSQPLQITALSVDASDNLYVGYLGANFVANVSQGPATLLGVAVYAPNASGTPTPVQSIPAAGVVAGAVFDAAGNLYVSERTTPTEYMQRASIRVFATPATDPQLVRTISGTSFPSPLTTSGLAIDDSGELYVANMHTVFPVINGATFSAYPSTANGRVRPDRTIEPPSADLAYASVGLATANGLLYASFAPQDVSGGASGVYLFHADQNGRGSPLQTLASPDGTIVEAVAVGP